MTKNINRPLTAEECNARNAAREEEVLAAQRRFEAQAAFAAAPADALPAAKIENRYGVAGNAVEGDIVRLPDGSYGRIEYVKGEWVGVRQGRRIDEWQPSQLVRC